jgi:hypothetical protein
MEELRDVYNHFLLYYGSDIPKMRNLEKVKRREEKNEERGEDEPREEDDDHDQVKQASRKSGYTICVKNKLGMNILLVLYHYNNLNASLKAFQFSNYRKRVE